MHFFKLFLSVFIGCYLAFSPVANAGIAPVLPLRMSQRLQLEVVFL